MKSVDSGLKGVDTPTKPMNIDPSKAILNKS